MSEIKPGEGVAVFRLPVPAEAFSYITEAIEHLYGTGASMMAFRGDQIQINAPKDGFGPLKKSRRKPTPPDAGGLMLVWQEVRDGKVKVTYQDAEDRVRIVAHMLLRWFTDVGGVNYVEQTIQADGFEHPFIMTMQMKDGLTPHEAREAAEAKLAQAEQLISSLEALHAEVDYKSGHNFCGACETVSRGTRHSNIWPCETAVLLSKYRDATTSNLAGTVIVDNSVVATDSASHTPENGAASGNLPSPRHHSEGGSSS